MRGETLEKHSHVFEPTLREGNLLKARGCGEEACTPSCLLTPLPSKLPNPLAEQSIMGAGAVATAGDAGGFKHLLDPNRKWYNNWRYVLS